VRGNLCFFFRIFLGSGIFLIITGCATTRHSKKAISIEKPDSLGIAADSERPQFISDEFNDSIGNIAELISTAKKLCAEKNFLRADSILKIVIETAGLFSSDSICYEIFLNDIVEIYTEFMPEDFQVPEEIVTLVNEQKMFKALDSISFDSDSSFMQSLLCGKSTSYNMPVVWNERVLRATFYYYKNRKTTIDHWIPRASQYLATMKKIIAEHGLPEDLAYLPLIESGFRPKAYSHAHASGIWQFIPSTGKIYGLRNNYWLDERRDPLKSTVAAARYLKKLYSEFNDWHLALAAYNCGEGGLSRAINRSNSKNYWDLNLPRETMNYVPLFLAALTIAKNPSCFNLDSPADTATFLFDTVRISDCLDLKDIADGIGIDYDTLRKFNPHILHWCTPPDMSNVLLYLPRGYSQVFKDFHASIPDSKKVKWYRYKIKRGDNIGSIARHFKVPAEPIRSINRLKNDNIIAGKYLFIPIPVNRAIPVEESNEQVVKKQIPSDDPLAKSGQKIIYQVKAGDSVWKISELFGISVDQICTWNKLSDDAGIRVGQMLTIYQNPPEKKAQKPKPSEGYMQYRVQPGDTPFSIARKFAMSVDELIMLNDLDSEKPVVYTDGILTVKKRADSVPQRKPVPQKPLEKSRAMKYQVSSGETLFGIARLFSVSVQELRSLNNLSESSVIKAGDTLLIPFKSSELESSVVFYEVKQGDNLWRIANTFGISVQNLYKHNNLKPDSVLMPGDIIKVVRAGEM